MKKNNERRVIFSSEQRRDLVHRPGTEAALKQAVAELSSGQEGFGDGG